MKTEAQLRKEVAHLEAILLDITWWHDWGKEVVASYREDIDLGAKHPYLVKLHGQKK